MRDRNSCNSWMLQVRRLFGKAQTDTFCLVVGKEGDVS